LKGLNMINFKIENEGTWFSFEEDNPDSGKICLRIIPADEYDRILELTIKHPSKIKRGEVKTEIDDDLARKLRWDYQIVDWSDTFIEGEPAECSIDNKEKLMKRNAWFRFFVNEHLNILSEASIEITEARLKNLPTS